MINSCLTADKIKFKRRELKYVISEKVYAILRQRLSAILMHDNGCSKDSNGYFIRSLYFDSIGDQALYEKLGGYDSRKKYRIRIYDLNDSRGKFEIKAKRGELIHKSIFWLSKEEITKAQIRDYSWMKEKTEPHWKQFHHIFISQEMKPVVIIDYVRDAYMVPFNNLRITFDKDLAITPVDCLKGCSMYEKILNPYKPMGEKVIMEIKFDGIMTPKYIKTLLSGIDAPRLAVSKYVIGRLCFSNQPWHAY